MKSQLRFNNNNIKANYNLLAEIYKHKILLLMLLPGLMFIIVFKYFPLYGAQIAFRDYSIAGGIWGSDFVGFKHFHSFFTDTFALASLKNTIIISILRLMFCFTTTILLAIMINEVGSVYYKRIIQTVSYLPYFLSWIIVAGLFTTMLSPTSGLVNVIIKGLGFEPIFFMADTKWFRAVLVMSGVWKEVGWGSVVYLAALSSIDPQLYEAAVVDGASRIKRIIHITIPSILPLACVMLAISMGNILNANFDQVFNMYNVNVMKVADIIDTYTYRTGLVGMQYGFATAVGLFKSVVGLILLIIVNKGTKSIGQGNAGLF